MIELFSADGSARALILPEYGGRLHQLSVTVGGQDVGLLWGPGDVREYLRQPTRGGSFPMAPWPNRVRGGRFTWEGRAYSMPAGGKPHASHGRVFQDVWEAVAVGERGCTLRCAFDDGWPWDGWAEQRFDLGDGELRMELSVHSTAGRFPAGCGWHPWFRRDVARSEQVRVRVPAAERYVLLENLPTGEVVSVAGEFDLRDGPSLGDRRLDDCYRGLKGLVEITWDGLRLAMDIQCQAPHLQVFTPEYAVAVEPQTCVADAFNLAEAGVPGVGMQVAEPDKPVRIATTWRWEVRS